MINNKDFDNTSYKSVKLIVDGKKISEAKYPIISIQTVQNINKIPTAVVVIRDGEEDIDNFENSSTSTFNPGNEVEIKLGWGGNDFTVFKGIIIRHGINASERKGFYLRIYCRNEALKMTTSKKNNCFSDLESDDAIIDEIFNNYSINISCNGDFLNNKSLIQYELSDWDFVLERSEANGKIIYYNNNDEKYFLETPDSPNTSLHTYSLGKDIVKFDAEADAEFQLENISTFTWDSAEQEMKLQESSPLEFKTFQNSGIKSTELAKILEQDEIQLKHPGERNAEEFKYWSKAKKFYGELSKVKGSIQILGESRYELCDCISIEGLGKKFSDKILITGIRHVFNTDGFYTDIIFGAEIPSYTQISADKKNNNTSLFTDISGLQVGKVVNILDEDALNRVEVNIPMFGEEAKIWCRVLYSDAGSNRGFFSLPEIDDEVILGFINNDPQCPIILGYLYSQKNKPSISDEEINEENNIKGWFSKSNISIIVNDDERSIKIDTPENNSILLNDETKSIEINDLNENKIELSENGINIECSAEMNIKSSGGITFSSDGDLNFEASNINIKASQNATIDGSSGTNLNSSGNTVIKGSMVQIN